MSTKKAVENLDPNEVGQFDPQLSKEANKKTLPEEKHEEVKEESEEHVENHPMLATLTGRNEVKSGRADKEKSKVASHDTKKDKVSKPLIEEPEVHENAEVPTPEPQTEQKALKDPIEPEAKESPKVEVKGHTGHTKEVSPKNDKKGEKHE